jgi:hypothetical protein
VKQGKSSGKGAKASKAGVGGGGKGGLKVNTLTSKKSLLKTIKEGLAEIKLWRAHWYI